MTGMRFSSTQVRRVSRTARSSSERRLSRFRKSTPVNWAAAAAVAMESLYVGRFNGQRDKIVRPLAHRTGAGGTFMADLPLATSQVVMPARLRPVSAVRPVEQEFRVGPNFTVSERMLTSELRHQEAGTPLGTRCATYGGTPAPAA